VIIESAVDIASADASNQMMRRQMLTAKRTVTPAQATMRRSQTHLTKEPD